jgi:hypothetical protein
MAHLHLHNIRRWNMIKKINFAVRDQQLQTQLLNLRVSLQNIEADRLRILAAISEVEGARRMLDSLEEEQEKVDSINELLVAELNSKLLNREDHALSAQPI